jgi:hypothetical protein
LVKEQGNATKLLFQGSRDGFKASSFGKACANTPKTLHIIKAKESGMIFGGFVK